MTNLEVFEFAMLTLQSFHAVHGNIAVGQASKYLTVFGGLAVGNYKTQIQSVANCWVL